MSSVLSAENLTTGYGRRGSGREISRGLNLKITRGTFTSLLGPNGSGKSTLLRTLAGLQPALSGQTFIRHTPMVKLPRERLARELSLVLTEPLDLGSMTVQSLVALGRFPHTGFLGIPSEQDYQVIHGSLEQVGIIHLAQRRYNEISDGEKQKAQIARALAQSTGLLVLDEPTVYLDLPGRIEILSLLKNLCSLKRITVLMSTHEVDLALRMSDEIWIMQKGGQLSQGAPEDLLLQGLVQETFENNHFNFDPMGEGIRLKQPSINRIKVVGKGTAKFLTERALRRIGYESVSENEKTDGQILMNQNSEQIIWTWIHGSTEKKFNNIADLIKNLRYN